MRDSYFPLTVPRFTACGFIALALLPTLVASARAEPVSFRNDVMAVLSKAGCNQGTCHGNQNGKNGFKLSLRGEDPDADFIALTRDTQGRRSNPLRPEESLLLRKASATVPHEGGRRFAVDSPEFRILHGWITNGCQRDAPDMPTLERIEVTPTERILFDPLDRMQTTVQATFSDGSKRDVTQLAVFEPSMPIAAVSSNGELRRLAMGETSILVRYLDKQAVIQIAFAPARSNFVWQDVPENNYVDRHVFAKLRNLRVQPSDLCADHVFLRRAFLDAIGVLPTAEETKAFLSDSRPDKRARLIDQLLQRPEFDEFWALKWSDLLRNEEKALDRKGVQVFHQWIRQSIADGKPMNEFARELMVAQGSTYGNPPANFYRANRDPQVRAETVAQVFLGIRLQCAKCHNHPFDRWTQDDYHSLSAFFARVQYRVVENKRRDGLDKHEFDGEQIVWCKREGEVKHPRTRLATSPRLLANSTRAINPSDDRLQVLADWVADPANPFFARTQVNRIWYHLMGRGIVDPIDDFRVSNPPVNRALLTALIQDFAAQNFHLRHVVRTIMNSRTYQLSAAPNETNRDDEVNFSHALVRPLQAEQLLDALSQVIGVSVRFNGYPRGMRAGQIPSIPFFLQRGRRATDTEQFLKVFGKPERLLACECERGDNPTLNQAFQLISGPLINDMLGRQDNRLSKLIAAGKSNGEIVQDLYLTALSRYPNNQELQTLVTALNKAPARRAALEDIAWGLVNSKEFLLRW